MKTTMILIALLCVAVASPVWAVDEPRVTDSATGMELVLVQGGCFKMGDAFGDGEKDELPVHEVCVSDFYMGKFEVTEAQWQKIAGTPSDSGQCGPDCPATGISWNMAQKYIGSLNEKSAKKYRLPTEAEWEYAARSGGKKEKWAGTGKESELTDFARFNKSDEKSKPKAGSRKPNGLGIYDMSGNAEEWCQDWYAEDYYAKSPKENPSGPSSGERRVLRGGSHNDDQNYIRTTARDSESPENNEAGFRLVLPVK